MCAGPDEGNRPSENCPAQHKVENCDRKMLVMLSLLGNECGEHVDPNREQYEIDVAKVNRRVGGKRSHEIEVVHLEFLPIVQLVLKLNALKLLTRQL